MSQVIKAKDTDGNVVIISNIDLSKGLLIEDVPVDLPWELKVASDSVTTTEFVGGRSKRG